MRIELTPDEHITIPTCPTLPAIYAGWDQEFALPYYKQSSSINFIGAMGPNRLGVSIGNDVNGVPVQNTLTPYGYYSIYNQRHTSKWAAYAVVNEDLTVLDLMMRAIEYSFKFQDYQGLNEGFAPTTFSDGRFPAIATSITTATMFDVIGNMSFFLADLQLTLHTLNQSTWFTTSGSTASHRARLDAMKRRILAAVKWLASSTTSVDTDNLTRSNYLLRNDTITPNRIFQQGCLFYGMGVYFDDSQLIARGKALVAYGLQYQIKNYAEAVRPATGIVTKPGYTGVTKMAFARTDEYLRDAPLGWGWFAEAGGSDSSYNCSNILFLLRLFVTIPTTDREFRATVWRAIYRAFTWQMRLFTSTGEVLLTDNTRVYNGGETFNGKPKTVSYLEWLFAMSFYGAIIGDSRISADAVKLLRFYTLRNILPNVPMSLYSFARYEALAGNIDLTAATLRVGLIQIAGTRNAPYTVSLGTHKYLTDIPTASFADISDSLTNVQFNPATGLLKADPILIEAVQPMPSLVQVGAIVVWVDTGDAATSPLLAYCSDATNLPFGPNGGDVRVELNGPTGHVIFLM